MRARGRESRPGNGAGAVTLTRPGYGPIMATISDELRHLLDGRYAEVRDLDTSRLPLGRGGGVGPGCGQWRDHGENQTHGDQGTSRTFVYWHRLLLSLSVRKHRSGCSTPAYGCSIAEIDVDEVEPNGSPRAGSTPGSSGQGTWAPL